MREHQRRESVTGRGAEVPSCSGMPPHREPSTRPPPLVQKGLPGARTASRWRRCHQLPIQLRITPLRELSAKFAEALPTAATAIARSVAGNAGPAVSRRTDAGDAFE